MRPITRLALVVGGTVAVVGGGALARSRIRRPGPAIPKPVTGMFPNGMAYLRLGAGPRTLLWIPGGPGNVLPTSALVLRMAKSWSRPFIEQGYTVWWVTRKQDMPRGHTFADMADDYGQLIADELGGKVDLVVGMSTGGQIGFYLAARHPDRFEHIAIAGAAYEDNERAKALLPPLGRLLSEGRAGEAMALMIEDAYPRLPGRVARVFGAVMGRSMYGRTHPHFASDVIVEVEAELACDARDVLPAIPVPVLLVCGDRDPYFPKAICEETARLIPDCTLQLQEGKGHEMALSDAWFARDVLDFVRERSATQPDRGGWQPPVLGRSVAASGKPVDVSPVGTGPG